MKYFPNCACTYSITIQIEDKNKSNSGDKVKNNDGLESFNTLRRPSLSAFVSLRRSDLFSSNNRRNSLADFRSPSNKGTALKMMLNTEEKLRISEVSR